MLQTLFYVGVLTPALIVVFLFLIFLICWFKCNLRERIYQKIGRGHNSTQSSLADTKDFQNGRINPQLRVDKENIENEDYESRCGSVRINMNHNIVRYHPGEFPYMKRESWRYMSSKSVSKCREEILRDKKFPPLPPIWTTAADSSSSVDSETAVTQPWLPPDRTEKCVRDSQRWSPERTGGWPSLHVHQQNQSDKLPTKSYGQSMEFPESSSDSSESLGTNPAIHRENTASRPLFITQPQTHTGRNYNYNQKTLNEKIPDKSYEQFLIKNELLKDNRLSITAHQNGCPKQLLLDSQDLGTSTDVDNIYLSVMPNLRAPIVSV